ncbi:MAG: hypothetical protein ACRDNI_10555 [Gaiellaceae bacterium]
MRRSFAVFLLVLTGCSTGSPDPGLPELRRQADALVPASSEVVDVTEGACLQVEGNPACVRIYLTGDLPEGARADALEQAARNAGWEIVLREKVPAGTAFELEREGYQAFAAVWTISCPEGRVDRACADEIQVLERP